MAAGHVASAAAILLAAYFIRGITGFGSGLISVPLLALFLPLKFVVPLILLLDFTASIVIGGFNFKRVRWSEVGVLIPFGVVGVVLGTSLLVRLPPEPMLMALAAFVFVFAVRSILNIRSDKPISRGWAVPASLTGGTVGALFGTGGPPYVIYLTHRIHDKSDLRATFSALFFTEGVTRIASFLVAGLLMTSQVWIAYFAALPLILGALYLGGRVHVGLTPLQMTRLVGVLLLVSSVSLLFKAMSV
ncbi:MAG: sulfite exporter TauE/SafE family protein [Gammaproteobacteria bacterium]|nr:sulfite exporter TauE/SafE family protein [Gammaproteobacteria bacterium]MBU1408423.1 sulfite exporter TauE/SafE family protein [Gammaproteobacteria bacterium]MBU1532235.1 sulfite exporter TauE/SafE family protein [Gammaproteobacteria bacterium]